MNKLLDLNQNRYEATTYARHIASMEYKFVQQYIVENRALGLEIGVGRVKFMSSTSVGRAYYVAIKCEEIIAIMLLDPLKLRVISFRGFK